MRPEDIDPQEHEIGKTWFQCGCCGKLKLLDEIIKDRDWVYSRGENSVTTKYKVTTSRENPKGSLSTFHMEGNAYYCSKECAIKGEL